MLQLAWKREAHQPGAALKKSLCIPQFCFFNWPKTLNSTQFIQGFQGRQNLYNLLVSRWSSHLSPSLSLYLSSGSHSQRPSQKAIEGFDIKINGLTLGLHSSCWALHSLQAPTNTGCFLVCRSLCWQWNTHFRNNSCHSYNFDLAQETKSSNVL